MKNKSKMGLAMNVCWALVGALLFLGAIISPRQPDVSAFGDAVSRIVTIAVAGFLMSGFMSERE